MSNFRIFAPMNSVVFDLGGVLFHRDPAKAGQELVEFFSFIFASKMPRFWEEYDRGVLRYDEVVDELCRVKGCSRAIADGHLRRSIVLQEPIAATEQLIHDLKQAGYRLFVLSNMSREFIDFLRRTDIYSYFDGEVVSCEEGTIKPEPRIYEILLERYALDASQTLFIDDRRSNIAQAEAMGIQGFLFQDPVADCRTLREKLLPTK